MDIVLSQLIMMPVLIILAWMYLHFRPVTAPGRGTGLFDAMVLVCAVLVSGGGLIWVVYSDIGNANRIWKPVLSIISTFHLFPTVLGAGWLLRRRLFR